MPCRVAAVSPSQLAFGLAAAMGFVASGGGCSDNSAPSSVISDSDGGNDSMAAGPSCPDAGGPVDPSVLIDGFEHSDANLPLIAGRAGGWFASGDGTAGAIMTPSG